MPTPEEVRAMRLAAYHTQAEAADMIGAALRSWQAWESGFRNMPGIKFDAYVTKTAALRRRYAKRKP